MTKCVLIVDDEADVRAITQMGLEMSAGWNTMRGQVVGEIAGLTLGALAVAADARGPQPIGIDLGPELLSVIRFRGLMIFV